MPIGSPFVETVLTWLPKTEGAYGNGELVFIEVTESEDLESGFLDGNPNQAQRNGLQRVLLPTATSRYGSTPYRLSC